jgi:septal ring factor EnvC (AmiA/AmiB activator)
MSCLILVAGSLAVAVIDDESRQDRLEALQQEMRRLRGDLEGLQGRERGVLGDLERLDTQLRLREAELEEISLRLEMVSLAAADRASQVARLEEAQSQREEYLAFRLRELYKRGPHAELRRLVSGQPGDAYLTAFLYAGYLSERDMHTIGAYREDAAKLTRDRDELIAERGRLEALRTSAERAREVLDRSRSERERMLDRIRQDRQRHQQAIAELEQASAELGKLAERLGGVDSPPALDVRKFRGLLDWPAQGRISAGFGRTVHPRFQTTLPHNGVDIEVPFGAPVRSTFDGRVVYAAWLHGYGLTVLVDHGGGVISVYAHASALVVQAGDRVARGQTIAHVGDTGSLKGPYLYFEIRENGRPVDPRTWLRR